MKRLLEEAHRARRFEAHLEWASPDRGPAEPLVPLARLLERGPPATEAAQHDAPHEQARFDLSPPTDERDSASKKAQRVLGQQGLERWNELVVSYGHSGPPNRRWSAVRVKRAPKLI